MRPLFLKRLSSATFAVMIPLALLAGNATATTPEQQDSTTSNIESICDVEVEKAPDTSKKAEKVATLLSSKSFNSAVFEISENPLQVAGDVADYFTEPEVTTVIIGGLETGDVASNSKASFEHKIKPFDLKCAKARAGWALYKAQGMLVCGPLGVANPLAGLVCKLATGVGGGKIDFNKLCD